MSFLKSILWVSGLIRLPLRLKGTFDVSFEEVEMCESSLRDVICCFALEGIRMDSSHGGKDRRSQRTCRRWFLPSDRKTVGIACIFRRFLSHASKMFLD